MSGSPTSNSVMLTELLSAGDGGTQARGEPRCVWLRRPTRKSERAAQCREVMVEEQDSQDGLASEQENMIVSAPRCASKRMQPNMWHINSECGEIGRPAKMEQLPQTRDGRDDKTRDAMLLNCRSAHRYEHILVMQAELLPKSGQLRSHLPKGGRIRRIWKNSGTGRMRPNAPKFRQHHRPTRRGIDKGWAVRI